MSEFIINKKEEAKRERAKVNTGTYVYGFKGASDYEDGDGYPMLDIDPQEQDVFQLQNAYAVLKVSGDKDVYYVKRGKHGKLFNPIGLYSEGTQHKQARHAGKPVWEFKRTTKKVFDFYINFLKTKNLAWLNNADREV